MNYNLMYQADFYKVSHRAQYPEGLETVHSVLTARSVNYNDLIDQEKFMWFGASLYIKKLKDFSEWFFNLDQIEVSRILDDYQNFLDLRLGGSNDIDHWADLWRLGHMPIKICAKPERSIQELQTPLLTVQNTHDDFGWLVGFLETTLLSNVWPVTTAANRSWNIRQCIERHMADHSEEEKQAIDFMAHDFSYRGLAGDEAAMLAGCGHLANFKGSDTIPAIVEMEEVYGITTGFSVPATEHSVMCAGGEENELDTFNRILDIYPRGIVSIVSDTWDYYHVLKETLPALKDRILDREGKVVIRPDSGDPVRVVCGGGEYESSLEILESVFGCTLDSAGLKLLNSKIGLIYGDGMNLDRIDQMLNTMIACGYSPLNIVFGVGSYTYQFMTRDELGFAFKATSVKINGEWRDIQKNPKTDAGKKSLTGRFYGEGLEAIYNGIV